MVSGRDFLGPYRLVKLVRAGQMCEVWEAIKDPNPHRIAVKVLRKDQIKNKEEIRHLKHEAEVGKDVKHANIIDIYEFNFDHELPFVAMELFNAKNLKQDIRDQSARVAHFAVEIIDQAAVALEFMHLKGWIHCDIKPDNFLVNDQGVLKLIDFAISQRAKKGGWSLFGFRGVVKGTRSYMSPEQIRGKSLDARADIYSFACVLFELLGGKAPFSGDNPDDLLTKHLSAPIPSLAPLNQRVTPEFTMLIQKMMAKNREQRPSSMTNFLKEFRGLRLYRTGMKPPPPEELETK